MFLIYVNRQEENMWHGQWIVRLYRFIISLYLTVATIYLYLISFFIIELKQLGVKNIYYLPLAVNTDRLSSQLNSQTREEKDRFSADISFVGSMYHKNSYDDIKDKLPPYLRDILMQLCLHSLIYTEII